MHDSINMLIQNERFTYGMLFFLLMIISFSIISIRVTFTTIFLKPMSMTPTPNLIINQI